MYIYEPPLTEKEREELTTLIIEDLVYRTYDLSKSHSDDYVARLRDIWAVPALRSFPVA